VVADPGTVDPRFMVDDAKLDRLAEVIRRTWPVEIDNADLRKASLIRDVEAARVALLEALELGSLA
jgi:succinylarginine dihydrolase